MALFFRVPLNLIFFLVLLDNFWRKIIDYQNIVLEKIASLGELNLGITRNCLVNFLQSCY